MPFLTIAGRCCCFNSSIEHSVLEKIHTANNLEEVVTVWDRLCDFFCGTNRVKAKKLLFKFFTGNPPVEERLRIFTELKKLCSTPYQEKFTLSITQTSTEPLVYHFIFNIEGALRKTKLYSYEDRPDKPALLNHLIKAQSTIYASSSEEIGSNLKKDICRGRYEFNLPEGQSYKFDKGGSPHKQQQKQKFLENLLGNVTEHQKYHLDLFCCQTLPTHAVDFIRNIDDKFIALGGDKEQCYRVTQLSNGMFICDYSIFYTEDALTRVVASDIPHYSNWGIRTTFLVDDTKAICLSADYEVNGEPKVLTCTPEQFNNYTESASWYNTDNAAAEQ